jgi:hypothetical protein
MQPQMPLALQNVVELTLRCGNAEILCQCKSFLEAGHVQWGSLKGALVMLKRKPWSLGVLETPRTRAKHREADLQVGPGKEHTMFATGLTL